MKDKITIIGLGYVGLPLAVEFSKKFRVVGYDINKKKLIQWVQLSRPYDLSKGLFIFHKAHEKKYDLVKNISRALGKKIKFHLLDFK